MSPLPIRMNTLVIQLSLIVASSRSAPISWYDRHWNRTLLPARERHHLQCHLRQFFFHTNGSSKLCCLPRVKQSQSCAVVGNSGDLLNTALGSLIDQHDLVIRLNDAPIYKYEKYVGAKSSLRFGWNATPARANELAKYYNETFLKCLGGPDDAWTFHGFQKLFPDARALPMQCDDALIHFALHNIYPDFLGRPLVGNEHPTTGASAVFFSLVHCSRVSLFGITPTFHNSRSSYHYYGKRQKQHHSEHFSWEAEHDLWFRLSGMKVNEINRHGFVSFDGLQMVKGCHHNLSLYHPGFYDSWKRQMSPFYKPSKKERLKYGRPKVTDGASGEIEGGSWTETFEEMHLHPEIFLVQFVIQFFLLWFATYSCLLRLALKRWPFSCLCRQSNKHFLSVSQ